MASLEELLAEEGFKRQTNGRRKDRSMDEHRIFGSKQRHNSTKSEKLSTQMSFLCQERVRPVKETAIRSAPGSGELKDRGRAGNSKNAGLARPEFGAKHKNVPGADSGGRRFESREKKSSADGSGVQRSVHKKLLGADSCDKRRSSGGRRFESRIKKSSADGSVVQESVQILESRRTSLAEKHTSKNSFKIHAGSRAGDKKDYSNNENESCAEIRKDRPALDEAAVRAVISILAGYCSRLLRDEGLRRALRLECASCLRVENWELQPYAEQAVIANLDWGIDGVEAVARSEGTKAAMAACLHSATRMLSVAASLDVEDLRDGTTCGLPNSSLAACAHLYLAVTYKLQKNERIAAVHLLQVFCVSPFHGRLHFAPEVWEHLFLPHLVRLKVWYNQEMDSISSASASRNSAQPSAKTLQKRLEKVYGEHLDEGTRQFALYYKEWLMMGVKARPVPSPNSPSTPLWKNRLVAAAPRLHFADFAGQGGSPAHSGGSSVTLPPLSRSLWEAVFCTPKRTERPYGTISGKPNGEMEQSKPNISTTANRTALPLPASKLDSSHEIQTDEHPKGAEDWGLKTGVILDGKELHNEELLRIWDHMLNKNTFSEKCSIMCKLSDRHGNGLTLKKLANVVFQIQQNKTSVNSFSHLSPLSSTDMIGPNTDSERQTELTQCAIQGEENGRENKLVSTSTTPISTKSGFRNSYPIKVPKDFVCPVTDQVLEDPIRIETGQTYEHLAIPEWLMCGNTTCPPAGHTLGSLTPPSTDLEEKEAVDLWKTEHSRLLTVEAHANALLGSSVSCIYRTESQMDLISIGKDSPKQHSGKLKVNDHMETSNTEHLLTRDFSQNMRESCDPIPSIPLTLLTKLKQAVTTLCISASLRECEGAVQAIAEVWQETNGNPIVETSLSKTVVVDELMQLLSNANNERILRTTIGILAELAVKSESNRETILRADLDLKVIVRLLSSSMFPQAATLLYLLKPRPSQLASLDIMSLLQGISEKPDNSENAFPVHCTPQAAVVFLLEQLLTALEDAKNIVNAKQVIALEGIPFLLRRIELGNFKERISAVSVLWCCMQADGSCRHAVVKGIKKASIVELLHSDQRASKTVAIAFLSDLLCLNRRPLISKFLSELQIEGHLNTMHVLLAYLQTAPLEKQPAAATLLLQLDLQVEPQRYSVYREEALDAIISALGCEKNTKAQVQSAKALLILEGRFSYFGRALSEAWLLKKAGLEDDFADSLKEEQGPFEEIMKKWNKEKRAAGDWAKKMASVLLATGKSLFEALVKCLSSEMPEVAKPCLVTATWLNCALASMPDTGMQFIACSILLPQLVKILQPDRHLKDRVLASLSLYTYMKNPECLHLLLNYVCDIIGPLRRLKWMTWTAKEVLSAIANDPLLRSHAETFVHSEVARKDASVNGETQALAYDKGKLYSGHADGSIKVWDVRNQQPMFISEVKEHERQVTCLAISESLGKLFSASADKSIRIWKLGSENLNCIGMVQMKEMVRRICAEGQVTLIISEGHGIKVLEESGTTKILNGSKHVQGLAVVGNKVFSGCTDWSLQEVDLDSGKVVNLQLGHRKLLSKRSAIHALQVFKDFLYTAGNSVDDVSVQIWKLKDRSLAATISTSADVNAMVVNEDFIYLGCNSSTGLIEVWLREKLQKVAVLRLGSKLTALAFGGDSLYSASEDGVIRAWAPI